MTPRSTDILTMVADDLVISLLELIERARRRFDEERAPIARLRVGSWFDDTYVQFAKRDLVGFDPLTAPFRPTLLGMRVIFSSLVPDGVLHWEDRDGRTLGITTVTLTPWWRPA